jgi:hypothetical protein
MKKIIYILFLVTLNIQAQDRCEKDIAHYGDGKHTEGISEDCIQAIKNYHPDISLLQKTFDERLVYHGQKIIMFEKKIDEKSKYDFIAGKMTEIEEIKSIKLINEKKEIIVVTEGNELYFYSSYVTGNVAPLRKITSVNENILDITYLPTKDEVLLLTDNHVYVFDSSANAEGFKKNDKFKKRFALKQKYDHFKINENGLFLVSKKLNQEVLLK